MPRLGVLLKQVGVVSETFIRRHVEDLASTAAVVAHNGTPGATTWSWDGPLLRLHPNRWSWTAARVLAAARSAVTGHPPTYWQLSASARERIVQFLKAHGVEVVLAEYLDPWVDLVEDIQAAGLRFFIHGHGYDVSKRLKDPRWHTLYRRYSDAHGLIAVSRRMRDRLADIGIPKDKIHIVPYGVDVPDRSHLREVDPGGSVRCLAVGRMVPKKAPLELMTAFEIAARQEPALELELIGDGPLLDEVRALVAEAGLEDRVVLRGALSHDLVLERMVLADLYLQHSVRDATGDEEGLPVSILEAMASGLPVISTRHAGIPEAVVDGVTGLLVEEHDVDGMAQAVLELARDYHVRNEMGRRARERARSTYSWVSERRQLRVLLGLT